MRRTDDSHRCGSVPEKSDSPRDFLPYSGSNVAEAFALKLKQERSGSATASLVVSAGSDQLCSTNASSESKLPCVWHTFPAVTKGEMISNGTRGPYPRLSTFGGGT